MMPFFYDFHLLLWVAPAILLALWAQMRIRTTYAHAQQVPVNLSGAGAARHILDAAGLQHVTIEPIGGELTDHYDPQHKVLRLSEGVFGSRSAAAVGIAAHEAGHALQDAHQYAPLVIRNHLIVGVSGDFDNLPGILRAFDPNTGREQWTFYSTPPAGTPGSTFSPG